MSCTRMRGSPIRGECATPYATNDGVRIRYELEGSGPPLLLHIGFVDGLEDGADVEYVAPLARS